MLETIPGLIFPLDYRPALTKILGSSSSGEKPREVKVRNLPLKSDGEKVEMALALWSEGLVCTV